MTRVLGAVVLGLGLLFLGATPATAGVALEPPAPGWCFQPNDAGELPTCTWDGTHWQRSFDGGVGMGVDSGMPGSFGVFLVFAILVAVGTTVWKVSLARRVARASGMDPDRATEVTLLADDGLEAAYLAGNLRPRPAEPAPPPAPARTVEARLRELQTLREAGLVTPEEYDARRKAIVDSL